MKKNEIKTVVVLDGENRNLHNEYLNTEKTLKKTLREIGDNDPDLSADIKILTTKIPVKADNLMKEKGTIKHMKLVSDPGPNGGCGWVYID